VTVYLVGAGPGDPGLLTVRGAEILARADVVVHDRLADASLLALAPAGALRIDVGKRPGESGHQDQIDELLVTHARAGRTVVRLKGGDPFVLGRGGEEVAALRAAGVAVEVVPGVTSAVAVPAYAGIPVTHRGLSTSFTVVTGHSRHAVDVETNWEALAAVGGTLVILMGVVHRGEIAARLLAAGMAPSTPVAGIRWGTRPGQTTVRTTLEGLAAAPLEPPATLVIGSVAALDLGWWEHRPLHGRRVVVTRARDQASTLVAGLRERGAEVVELATIAIADPADGGAALGRAAAGVAGYDWVIFTSTNAVERFCRLLRDGRAFGPARLAAVGSGTADALARHGLVADLVPDRFDTDALLAAFPAPPARGGRVLLPRAEVARPELPVGLRVAGWDVEEVSAYRTVAVRPSPAELAAVAGADAVTFTSSSTVTNFIDAAGRGSLTGAGGAGDGSDRSATVAARPAVVCLGPVTARTAEAAGLTVDAVASPSTIEGLLDAVGLVLARRLHP